jgi:sugar lactone lactonase YvrE
LKPTEALKHSFGDLTLDAAGNVYVSDSGTPAIYLLRSATDALEPLTTDARFVNLQGIALDEKRKTLYIADYSVGIYALDLATKELRLLAFPSNVTVLGIDGLYFDRGRLIAIQNGISPHRVARVTLDSTAAKITAVDVLEANHPLFDEPTLGVIERGRFYFIANSQWGAFDARQNLPNVSSMKEPVILQLKLR